MPIDATNPTVIPAREEVTYPNWYVVGLVEDGSAEFSPSGETVQVAINDIMALAASDAAVAEWLTGSIALIVAKATEQGVL